LNSIKFQQLGDRVTMVGPKKKLKEVMLRIGQTTAAALKH